MTDVLVRISEKNFDLKSTSNIYLSKGAYNNNDEEAIVDDCIKDLDFNLDTKIDKGIIFKKRITF